MKNPSKRALTNKLDRLISEICKMDAGYKCTKCGKDGMEVQLQCAHIYSRVYRSTRWALLNVLCLCAGCHFWAHKNPVDFSLWIIEKFPGRVNDLNEKRNEIFKINVSSLTEKLGELEIIKKRLEELQ